MKTELEVLSRLVTYGNGVHNKKYSIMLIDVAFDLFEDVNDILEGELDKPGSKTINKETEKK